MIFVQSHSTLAHVLLRGVAAIAFALVMAGSAAAAYPDRQVKIVVPFGAGTSPDTVARVLGEFLSKRVGRAVVVENRVGAAGMIGAEFAARSTNDGYTLLLGGSNLAIANTFNKNLRFDIQRDLVPITMIGSVPSILVVSAKSELKSVADLVAFAKAHPKQVTFASSGVGTTQHLAGELFNRIAGVEMTHVPYSTTGRLADLVSGRVTLLFDNLPSSVEQIKSGMTRGLALSARERSNSLPEVPTFAEVGMKGFDVSAWYGMLAPAGTPNSVLDYLNVNLRAVLADSAAQEKLKVFGLHLIGGSRQDTGSFYESEMRRWGQIVRDANIKD